MMCVCCRTAASAGGRPIVLRDGAAEWVHVDDETAAATWHAHVEREGRDCDGVHGSSYVMLPLGEEELASEFDMWMRVAERTVNPASAGGTLTTETIDGRMRATWSAPTDEGYEHEVVTMCIDPECAYQRHTVYDQYAELMGY